MSLPKIVAGTYIAVRVEDPENPGTFIPLCGMTTKNFTDQIQTRDRFLRDCATPEALPVRGLVKQGRQWDLSASGLYNRSQAALISTLVGKTKNYQFFIGEPADDEVYASFWQGPGVVTQRQIGGDDDDDGTQELTIASDGEWVETVL